jgi:molecular chaperone GrpE
MERAGGKGRAADAARLAAEEAELEAIQADADAEADVEPEPGSEDGPAGASAPERAADATGADDPLALAEAQRDEYLAMAQRAQADFDNFRKRAARETAAAGVRAKASLATKLLPVLDNLERALASAGEGEEGLAEGVKLVHSELVAALERSGVKPIEADGEAFDPNVHEALSTRSENGAEAGQVLDVVQKGYRLEGTVLRPARVVVAA